MRVVWTEHAYAQLDEAVAFIARDHLETAKTWLELILAAGDSLAEFPDRGRVVPEASRDDVRQLILSPYRLIYRRDPNAVTITMLLHEHRKLSGKDVRMTSRPTDDLDIAADELGDRLELEVKVRAKAG